MTPAVIALRYSAPATSTRLAAAVMARIPLARCRSGYQKFQRVWPALAPGRAHKRRPCTWQGRRLERIPAPLAHRHLHHVVVEVGHDPDRAGDDQKTDQHAEGERDDVVG